MDNYTKGLELINSRESYDEFKYSGLNVIEKDENRTIADTLKLAAEASGL